MDAKRWMLPLGFAAATAALVILLLRMEGHDEDAVRRDRDAPERVEAERVPATAGRPLLVAHAEVPLPGGSSESRAGVGEEVALERYEVEVIDYRGHPVEGVRVYVERDVHDHAPVRTWEWRILAEGETDAGGRVALVADPRRREDGGDGVNHRLRFQPPEDREDLPATFLLWRPVDRTTYRLARVHSLRGSVVGAGGIGVAGATVFVGHLPRGDHVVVSPQWDQTRTDAEGRFVLRNIPATDDGMAHVWAAGPGEEPPATSRDVVNGKAVPLDARDVEVRLP